MRSSRRRGFTLLEVFIVLGMLIALAAFLLPAFKNARELALQVQCASRLRALGHAFILYASDNDGHMVTTSANGPASYSYNWVYWKPAQGTLDQSPLARYLSLRGDELRRAFCCPAAVMENQTGYPGSGRYTLTFTMNEFMNVYFGMTYPKVRNPSHKILVYDENERSDDDIFWWGTDRDTIAGRHGSASRQSVTYVYQTQATYVTRRMGNVLFFDGHVELADNEMCHDPAWNDPNVP